MILTNITNQSVAIFFTIFPELNHGIQYPLAVTISSLVLNVLSVVLWIKGEKNYTDDSYDELDDIEK